MRLNKWIADSGLCSRRTADRLIGEGEVRVNGKVVSEMGVQIDPKTDVVTVQGQPLSRPAPNLTILFHKPKGVVTTRSDEKGRKTIYDALDPRYHHLDPVGRLDKDSTGAIILSSDGELVYRLSHPRYHVAKIYRVRVTPELNRKVLQQLGEGIFFETEGKLAQAQSIEWEKPDLVKMVLITGYNRQIRRMMEAVQRDVLSLKRIAVGPIKLGKLAVGAARLLSASELNQLRQDVGLKKR